MDFEIAMTFLDEESRDLFKASWRCLLVTTFTLNLEKKKINIHSIFTLIVTFSVNFQTARINPCLKQEHKNYTQVPGYH